ncbi:Cob(I)yrinic acid a,c-diamide adenosyltransferase, mitochondrial [Oopsacas minuta]|uniref:Corrinoid adenosyltransferase MMAB n=1 Tax=Oopsacas minuta TaxID=111878 RepID=A0AAV7K7Z7_9METZ|nr:Cob(I)yrinic acid a,c-diamide adenosyltransferase, mitochondrial [Oopsacas minuta]
MADTQTSRPEINGSVHLSSQPETSIIRQVRSILYWENTFTSICSLLITLMILQTFSFYPGIHATLLVLLGSYTASLLFILSFIIYCVVVGREPHNPFNVWLSDFKVNTGWILNQLGILLDLISPYFVSSLRLIFFFNLKDSLTVMTLLWIMSYFSSYISLLEITYVGDKGLTSNYVGTRIPKDDVIIEALGTTDELSSQIGLIRAWIARIHSNNSDHQHLLKLLASVQCHLQDIGSHIATPPDTKQAGTLPVFKPELVKELEYEIDEMTSRLPPLKHFILPGGGMTAGYLHVARSVCRRSERRVVPLIRAGELSDRVGVYLNRLSDFLFTTARWASHIEGEKDTIYK